VLYASLSAWDTAADAREFFEAYLKRLQLVYPESANIQPQANGHFDSSARMFDTANGRVTIQLYGSRVLVCEGLPVNQNAAKLVNLLRNGSEPKL
jgi:hypothetical protein